MKKVYITIFVLILSFICISGIGYAYFSYYKDNATIGEIEIAGNNSYFEEVDDDYYKVYFFASPYYATGAEIDNKTITDPLEIANSSKNPYNDTSEYMLIGPALQGNNIKNANVAFPADSTGKVNYHYISYKSRNEDVEPGVYGAFERFQKRDYTGYIRANESIGITQTYQYISMTVGANIESSVLSSLIASSEFKDMYGFGPEFIGWTYDYNTTKQRTMYGTSRYYVGNNMRMGDTRGWGINGVAYQIGNFGCQGEIEQITAHTSLSYIDNLQMSSDDENMSIDGSKKGDRVIYLYPVFAAKNYSSDKSIDGKASPFIKFRINPEGRGEDGNYIYRYKQSGEIDYSLNRYTSCLFQKSTTTDTDINYYLNNLFIDTTGSGTIKNMQLDCAPTNSSQSWVEAWSTILTYDELKSMNLPTGYYNVDMTFIQLPDGSQDEAYISTKVTELYEQYKATNKYKAIYTSKQNDDRTVNGIYWLPVTEGSTAKKPTYYVIGFSPVQEFAITENVKDEDVWHKEVYAISLASEYKQYYNVNSLTLKENTELIITSNIGQVVALNNTLKSMANNDLEKFNTALDSSTYADKIHFLSVGDASSNENAIINKNNTILIKKTGNYDFVITVDYVDGEISQINVAYKKNIDKYAFVVLTEKPKDLVFIDYESLIYSDSFLVACEMVADSKMNELSVLYSHSAEKEASAASTIKELFENNKDYLIIDTATEFELTLDMFKDGNFVLNRNYILYLQKK